MLLKELAIFGIIFASVTLVSGQTTTFLGQCSNWPAARFADPEIKMDVPQIIRSKGYPVQIHEVVTADGYLLTVHRIPYGKKNATQGRRPVVFLQHGLVDSSFTWVANFEHNSLAFMLADQGFDVWLGNVRGNTYSKKHVSLKTNTQDYWRFSWDEMAKYDLPAFIDYVTRNTGVSKVYYAGHSQGTAIGFSGFGINPSLASKVSMFFALAPVTKLGNMKSPLKIVSPLASIIEKSFDLFGASGEFLPSDKLTQTLAAVACGPGNLKLPICRNIVFLIVGYDCVYTNQTRLPVYTSKIPAGTSVQNMVKYAQSYMSDKFQYYDFGTTGNLKHYKQATPPQYDLKQMKVPTVLFYGSDDWLATPKDTEYIIKNLPNLVEANLVNVYNHLDFVWGINANTFVYDKIISRIKADLKWR